ncbi:hypothetical protein [Wufeng Murina leucogaster paramyxovirus 1]|nr:hypothetical protein [Wufeng Murina leucogaster paramyxovirus 1]
MSADYFKNRKNSMNEDKKNRVDYIINQSWGTTLISILSLLSLIVLLILNNKFGQNLSKYRIRR